MSVPEITLLANAVRAAATACPAHFVVAIDGPSGSGKSTLAAHLAPLLDARVIDGDDFYAGGTTVREDSPATLVETCIDWRRQRQVLAALRRGDTASWHPFDWDRFDGQLADAPRTLAPGRMVILEGVYASRPELEDLVDFHILVDTPPQTRWQRLLAREGELGPWERQWHAAEDHYFNIVLATRRFGAIYRG